MNTEWLQSLCAAILMLGVVFVSLGGLGTYYFSHKSAKEKETKRQEMTGWITALERSSVELRDSSPAPSPAQKAASPSPQPGLAKLDAQPAQARPTPMGNIEAKAPTHEAPVAIQTPAMKTPVPPIIGFMETKTPSLPPVGEQLSAPDSTESKKGRSLNQKQYDEIVDVLRKHAGKTITIRAASEDPEGFEFATILKRAFTEAGWKVDGVKQVKFDKPTTGLNLSTGTFPSPEGLVATYLALTAAGFPVSQQLDSKLTGNHAELTVGTEQ